MACYFTVNLILGFLAGCAIQANKLQVMHKPLWLSSGGGYGQIALLLASVSWLISCVITIFEYGLFWFIISFAEVALGAVICLFVPSPMIFFVLYLAPVISIVLLGSRMGFWYI
jgi:hypothetical protein